MDKHSKKKEVIIFISSIIPSFILLRKNDPLRMAGATAFFTTFALPPIVFIVAQFFGLFAGARMVGRGLIDNIAINLGADGARQIRQVIRAIHAFNNSWYTIVFGFLFLLFVATTLFIIIKNSFNQIWQIRINENSGFLSTLGGRLRSLVIIILVGILFFVNLFLKSIESIWSNYFEDHFNKSSIYFKVVFSEVTSVLIVAIWFTVLFRFLADKKPAWKAAIVGGILTGILFTIGRFLLKILLINSNISALYGSSGSMVLIMLFVFYTSLIMYYGAGFIAVYAEKEQLKNKES